MKAVLVAAIAAFAIFIFPDYGKGTREDYLAVFSIILVFTAAQLWERLEHLERVIDNHARLINKHNERLNPHIDPF